MCVRVETSIVSRYLNNPSTLLAICTAHADATSVRGSLQGSHKFLVFYSFHNVSFFNSNPFHRFALLRSFIMFLLTVSNLSNKMR